MKSSPTHTVRGTFPLLHAAWVLRLILTGPGPALGAPRQKVLFDCDLAGDVDDAYAVALLLTSPEFEVLGVVMDHGHTWGRARVAGRLLHELALDERIPLVIGRPTPGIVGEDTVSLHHPP